MTEPGFTILETRGLIRVAGKDARGFLQGLISNDIHKVGPDQAIYAAFLTPQGKYLFDFFVFEMDGAAWLDCEADRAADFRKRLSIYKLRTEVAIEERNGEFVVAAVFGEGAAQALGLSATAGHAANLGGGVVFVDSRLAEAGARAVLPAGDAETVLTRAGLNRATFEDYDAHRIRLGLPDGSRDMVVDKTTLLEAGFDELNGIDWNKGCYMGQELTARTRYRGLVKKRLVPVTIDGPVPASGTPILLGGKEVGEMRSALPGAGLALMRIEHLSGTGAGQKEFLAGNARLTPRSPKWANDSTNE